MSRQAWTKPRRQRVVTLALTHNSREIGEIVGATAASVRQQLAIARRESEISDSAYTRGKFANNEGLDVSACPETDVEAAAWWKAGWHDADIEAGNSWL